MLGAAYAAASQFDRAIISARAALTLAIKRQAGRLAAEIRAQLQSYEQTTPYVHDFSGASDLPR